MNFFAKYMDSVKQALRHDHNDNHDFIRHPTHQVAFQKKVRMAILNVLNILPADNRLFQRLAFYPIWVYQSRFEKLHALLSDQNSRNLLKQIILYYALGQRKVKLPLSTPDYWHGIKKFEKYAESEVPLKYDNMNFGLIKHHIKQPKFDLRLFIMSKNAYTTFELGQYQYKTDSHQIIASKNDTVLDFGACYGDTAHYFSELVGNEGKVFSFEFIPSNLNILNKNIALNKNSSNIKVIERPVWSESEKNVYILDNGPGSKVSMQPISDTTFSVKTVSIDDFCTENNLYPDFIKMDIEGSELPALKGGIETIRRCRPKLAIAIYHSIDDFVNIPQFIHSLDLKYEFFLGHFTIHREETILFAYIPENRLNKST